MFSPHDNCHKISDSQCVCEIHNVQSHLKKASYATHIISTKYILKNKDITFKIWNY